MSLTDFQKRTAAHAFSCLMRKNNARFLVADEVGLGKTIVAREIISNFLEEAGRNGKTEFTVVYICNNQLLAKKNLSKLNPITADSQHWQSNMPMIDRLSLFPFVKIKSEMDRENQSSKKGTDIFKLLSETEEIDNPVKRICHFYALTPNTSLKIGDSYGTVMERQLLYHLAEGNAKANNQNLNLDIEVYRQDAKQGWEFFIKYFNKYHSIIEEIIKVAEQNLLDPISDKKEIPEKRRLLARLGASLLNPDLVIFDEFQNYEQIFYPNLAGDKEDDEAGKEFRQEIDIINTVFARLNPAPKYLLLSATPFAPLTMSEELARGEFDLSSCEAFSRLIDWLNNDSPDTQSQFRQDWQDYAAVFKNYCENLRKGIDSDQRPVLEAKDKVQKIITRVMSRTERPIKNLQDLVAGIDLKNSVLNPQSNHRPPNWQQLFSGKKELADLEKYAFRPLSTMGRDYETFNQIIGNGKNGFVNHFLPDLDAAMKSPYMQKLKDALCDKNNELRPLFWMPPTVPSLELQGAFRDAAAAGYSKILVFSQYRFIPRMISAGFSNEFENDYSLSGNETTAEYKFFDESKELRKRAGSLLLLDSFDENSLEEIFKSPAKSVYWAFRKLLLNANIRDEIKDSINSQCRVWSVLIASALMSNMLNSTNIGFVEAVVGKKGKREEKAARYLRKGCFGDAAYEYLFLLSQEIHGEWSIDKLNKVGRQFFHTLRLRTNTLKLYFKNSEPDLKTEEIEEQSADEGKPEDRYSRKVRIHFADCFSEKEKYSQGFSDDPSGETRTRLNTFYSIIRKVLPEDRISEKELENLLAKEQADRNKELQAAFNSPFKPFVLSTTSIGQEGLDFHWYCRKIMHWNLPSNPVDFDQREGRINRYGSFALRQIMAGNYPPENRGEDFTWEKFWNFQSERCGDNADGMIPHWLPPESCKSSRKIERIIPFYPLSKEHLFINDLLKLQAVYRMVIGQPHQDELLSLLRELSDADREKIGECMISLSPPSTVRT